MASKRAQKPGPNAFERWQEGLSAAERRVDEIVQKMNAGAWLSGVSERAMAIEHGVTPAAVRKWASEASRALRRELRDDPGAREARLSAGLQTFEVIRAKAMAKGDSQALRVALDATRALLFYQGLEPAKKLDVRESDGGDFDGWSLDEMEAYAKDGRRPRRAAKKLAAMANGSADAGGGEEPVH
jgi:hypothetical protein